MESTLRKELEIAKKTNTRLLSEIARLAGLTEEVQDTQNFLRHREKQMQAIENRSNRLEGAIRGFLFNGRTQDLEDALQPQPEDEWRPPERRGRYRGQAEED